VSVSVTIVGSGSAGRRHAAAVRRVLPNADLIVVQRPRSTQPTALFAEIGARIVSSIEDALDFESTLAIVANPAPHHRRATEILLAAGSHVLVEKPLAASVNEAEAVVRAASEARRELVVGYHLRYSDTARSFKHLLASGTIGEPTTFHLAVGQHLDQWRPGGDPRHSVSARHELGGGVLLELSHELDGVRYLLGDVNMVSARLAHTGAPTDGVVETVADLEICTVAGAAGTVHLDMVAPTPFRRWEVGGSTGRLVADLLTGRIERWDARRAPEILATSPPGERDRAGHRLIDNLVAAAAGTEAPRCTGADGVAAVAIVEAALASARTHQPCLIAPP